MKEITEMFKALGDETRLRIVNLLNKAGKALCVCEFVDALEETQYNISRHLKALRNAGLVDERKEGRWVYYSLSEGGAFQKALLKALSVLSEKNLKHDEKELDKRLKLRENGKCLIGIQKPHLKVANA